MHTDFFVFPLSLKINYGRCGFEKHLNLPERWYCFDKNMISIHNAAAQNNKYIYKRISAAPEQYNFRRISKKFRQIKNWSKHVYNALCFFNPEKSELNKVSDISDHLRRAMAAPNIFLNIWGKVMISRGGKKARRNEKNIKLYWIRTLKQPMI